MTLKVEIGEMRRARAFALSTASEAGLNERMVRDLILRSVGRGRARDGAQELTPRARSAVEIAVNEATRAGGDLVDSEHLLLGLLRDGGNMAVRILVTAGYAPLGTTFCSFGKLTLRSVE